MATVYPYLLEGTLDEVFEYKVENGGTMTIDEYKDYYDRAALLEEVINWPTYYPSSMDGHTIAHEMMAH